MLEKINIKTFKDFFSSGSAGGFILIACLILSLAIANSPLGAGFNQLLTEEIGFSSNFLALRYSVIIWINDGLMAIFFLLVGLEIKREMVEGELATLKKASLPAFAALGGMVVPAIIYALLNINSPTANGWGIPMATDIAFAIAILSLLGDRVPVSLKVFLTALAIVDDLGAILVIAVFYSTEMHLNYLLYAGGVLALLVVFNLLGVKSIFFYLVPGLFMWYFIHHSGVHATIAGVLTALTLPTTPDEKESPLEYLEHALTKPVNFIIMPIFALANTNIRLEGDLLGGLTSQVGLGIMLGLLIGKPVGITILSWVAVRMGLSTLPQGVNWPQIMGAGVLAGIGFTMSIFITLLSFDQVAFQEEAKFAILVASLLAGLVGFIALNRLGKRNQPTLN